MNELFEISMAMKEELRAKLGSPQSSFDLWFGDFNLTSLDENRAVFSTPTKLRKQILSTRYITLIKETMTDVIGFPVEIEIYSLDEDSGFTPGVITPTENMDKYFEKEALEKSERKEKKIEEILNTAATEKKSLLDEYTFENFIEGESNKMAKAVCFAVANGMSSDYNPLFLYGHSGLGKTHLLYAIMNHMKKRDPGIKIVYKKSETFINELIDAISSHSTSEFKEKYRSADVLMIDDIQFIAGKESTQEEFFHTFSALYEAEKMIILTSDRPPMEINPLMERLRTRFEWGLVADIQPPSFELRIAIIKKKSKDMGLSIPSHLIDYIAQRLNNNIRQIEGILKKLYAIHSFTGLEITKESIDSVISIVDPGNIPNDAMVEKILLHVSKKYGVSVEDMKSKKKTDRIAGARHVSVYIIRKLTDLSLKEIGKIFGRDYSTVISSINKIDLNIKTVKNYEGEINLLIKEIKGI
ncbi:MAG: chromosomal replication initiator protein DnaA [Clostridia bacterium]|nr:chromosomal replication initiator protein DnaA [Clostridia bacterium]